MRDADGRYSALRREISTDADQIQHWMNIHASEEGLDKMPAMSKESLFRGGKKK